MLKHLLYETNSGDVLCMAMGSARREAELMQIAEADFDRVLNGVMRHWKRNASPIRGMF